MDTYSLLREIADSWVLLAMFGFFACAAVLAFLPSQNKAREDASMIPFRNETPETPKTCTGTCAECRSKASSFDLKGNNNV
jgi:cytochrome c oxidase cbb3-type subunit 4